VPEVPSEVLDPRGTWKDPDAYDAQATRLAKMFRDNFAKYAAQVEKSVAAAGP
jgi:phosphoenolpyruvate carboxykinase (ATP)